MRPPLVIGLGNPLAGDDGIGWHIADRLRREPRLAHVDVLKGDDLLRLAPELDDRPVIVLVDALLGDDPLGRVRRIPLQDLDDQAGSAHLIPPAQAIRLLRRLHPPLRSVPVVVLGIGIHDVRIGPRLSPGLGEALDAICAAVTRELELATAR